MRTLYTKSRLARAALNLPSHLLGYLHHELHHVKLSQDAGFYKYELTCFLKYLKCIIYLNTDTDVPLDFKILVELAIILLMV